ncbi:MAG: high-affinity iron transporter [Candidatus Tokpelaia sp. JSC188]|nr:MAG: high-affinity iron transporter [Candidatus Tokpelaia sp. JSC188]
MQAPLFIVWRESLEALLVIGILYAWLRRENLLLQISQLWIGIGFGLLLAGILAVIFWIAGQWFSGPSGEWFFTCIMIFASILILQTVIWMHCHGNDMKKRLETKVNESMRQRGQFSIMILAMIAIAREGSETVVFLIGIGFEHHGTSLALFMLSSAAGFGLAILTFICLQKFSSTIPWGWYFCVSECVLLFIGCGMMINACDKAAGQLSAYELPEWLYSFMDTPLWSTQWFLADNDALTSLIGYHADPSMMQIGTFLSYWIIAIYFMFKKESNTQLERPIE